MSGHTRLQGNPFSMKQESVFIEDQGHQLHLKHIYKSSGGAPILMVHGAIENGRIFYNEQGKGLACYLDYGQYEAITHDIPLLIDYVFNKTGQAMHLVSHSWGGVLVASVLARHSENLGKVRSNLCFGTKRSITIGGFEKLLKVDLFYNRIAPILAKRKGFFDAVKYKFGADNETKQSLAHSIQWVNKGPWHDPRDGFDYQSAAGDIVWPPTWHITGINDSILGNQVDVKYFIEESKNSTARFSLLSKRNGNAIDYGHIDILTSPEARNDHFPHVAGWLNQH